MLIKSLANYDSANERPGSVTIQEDFEKTPITQSESKFLRKIRAEGGDFSRIFMRMQERSKRMQPQLGYQQPESAFRIRTTTAAI